MSRCDCGQHTDVCARFHEFDGESVTEVEVGIDTLRARLAEVEAELEHRTRGLDQARRILRGRKERADVAEARLAAVEAERNAIATHADAMLSRAQRAEARLAEVEAERDESREAYNRDREGAFQNWRKYRARLAAVEAERDGLENDRLAWRTTAKAAEARLAAAEARCTQFLERTDVEWIRERQIVESIRAIARGEGDR